MAKRGIDTPDRARTAQTIRGEESCLCMGQASANNEAHLQDLGTGLLRGDTQRYLPVKTPRSPQRSIQRVWPIRGACTHLIYCNGQSSKSHHLHGLSVFPQPLEGISFDGQRVAGRFLDP